MVKEIIWSPLAVETYETIINYLDNSFGENTVKKFVQKVIELLKINRINIFTILQLD
jgi:plasmid stabilization system protein ParE